MSKLKLLVTGSTGMVGSYFSEKARDFQLLTPTSEEFNLLDPKSIENYLSKNTPDWIINFAAYTDVNGAESQKGDTEGPAWQINVEGVRNLLKAFKSKNFIQISTDMVFSGNISQPGPYAEDDLPPQEYKHLTWYGWTKNRAEELVVERGGVIIRIIYPVRVKFNDKLDYIRGPLQRYVESKLYPLFNDQQISITYVEELNAAIREIINQDLKGVFHVSSDTTTPYDLVKKVLDELGEDSSQVKSSSVIEFLKTQDNLTRYPVYGGLKTRITEATLGLHFSTWQTVVEHLIANGLQLPKK